MKWKYHLQLYEPFYLSERLLFGMLRSAAEGFAPVPDGFSYAISQCFRLSALHLHCALQHLHPFRLPDGRLCFAAFFFFHLFFFFSHHKSLMYKVITALSSPNTQEPNRFTPSLEI